MSECIKFCPDCPFSNGVVEATEYESSFVFAIPQDEFSVKFVGKDVAGQESVTQEVRGVITVDGVDSTMGDQVFYGVQRGAEQCSEPKESQRKVLGGLLGTRAVLLCGAFENGKKPAINVGWGDVAW